ncbi:MAG: aminotransferase class V-fold PLP-dependent enzyme [Fusobacteriaceae bacterium]
MDKIYYFDNSATSNPKPENVYSSVERAMKKLNSNPGRGGHRLAIKTAEEIYNVREKVANFFNLDNSLNVAFTSNSTMALNIAIRGIFENGDRVLTTYFEHNSVIRPLYKMVEEKIIAVEILKCEFSGIELEKKIKENRENGEKTLKAIVINHMSNVTGKVINLIEVGKICKENGILLIVDASQSAGMIEIDMKKMNIDILCFTGHKSLLGIQGIGGLCLREGVKLTSLIVGGTGSHSREKQQPKDMPDCVEAGTLNTPGIISLGAGIDFINSVGLKNIESHEKKLKERFIKGIKEIDKGDKIKLYTSYGEKDGPVVSLNIEGIVSSELSNILDEEFGIITRSGLHCAPLIHEFLGTEKTGTVRFSFGYFNTIDEIDYAVSGIGKILTYLD